MVREMLLACLLFLGLNERDKLNWDCGSYVEGES